MRSSRAFHVLVGTWSVVFVALFSAHAQKKLGEEENKDFRRSPGPSEVEWSIRPVNGWDGGRNEETQIKYIVDRAPNGQEAEKSKEARSLDDIPFVPKEAK